MCQAINLVITHEALAARQDLRGGPESAWASNLSGRTERRRPPKKPPSLGRKRPATRVVRVSGQGLPNKPYCMNDYLCAAQRQFCTAQTPRLCIYPRQFSQSCRVDAALAPLHHTSMRDHHLPQLLHLGYAFRRSSPAPGRPVPLQSSCRRLSCCLC